MKLYLIGICGTFMAGIARIACQLGHEVHGCDAGVYPPMSDQLQALGIEIDEGYELHDRVKEAELIIVGNVATRGMPIVEYLLSENKPFISAPRWLSEEVLRHKTVLAVTGTHGKTTTSSMLTWILEQCGKEPSFLIGGQAKGLEHSARLRNGECFVIEADEYDSAFFDKRAKFLNYFPTHCLINNLEFDHADIYPDLAAIQKQFHHLLKILPKSGTLIVPKNETSIEEVIQQGCWSNLEYVDKEIELETRAEDYSSFCLKRGTEEVTINWSLIGRHNAYNAMGAISLAFKCGVSLKEAAATLNEFQGVRRRLEALGEFNGLSFYDDFAHHPTAVTQTLKAFRAKVKSEPVCVFFEIGSNSMRQGVHLKELIENLKAADTSYLYSSQKDAKGNKLTKKVAGEVGLLSTPQEIINKILAKRAEMKHVIFMSNKNLFGLLKEPLRTQGLWAS